MGAQLKSASGKGWMWALRKTSGEHYMDGQNLFWMWVNQLTDGEGQHSDKWFDDQYDPSYVPYLGPVHTGLSPAGPRG